MSVLTFAHFFAFETLRRNILQTWESWSYSDVEFSTFDNKSGTNVSLKPATTEKI